jgi:hypothetical protein
MKKDALTHSLGHARKPKIPGTALGRYSFNFSLRFWHSLPSRTFPSLASSLHLCFPFVFSPFRAIGWIVEDVNASVPRGTTASAERPAASEAINAQRRKTKPAPVASSRRPENGISEEEAKPQRKAARNAKGG